MILNIVYRHMHFTVHQMLHWMHKQDSELDAFSRDLVGDSFTVLANLLAAFTTYLKSTKRPHATSAGLCR